MSASADRYFTQFGCFEKMLNVIRPSVPFLSLFCLMTLSSLSVVARGQDLLSEDAAKAQQMQAELLSEIRQLTFAGKRAGEGYFSADGQQLVFQSEREPDNPFFQIYMMDRETGDTRRVSPGHGKTTCAWIHPSGEQVLYASTQFDPDALQKQKDEIDFRASGQERRYSWDYDPTYELVVWDAKTGAYQKLTEVEGYDAEASYSADGNWICFASNRRAYSGELSDEEQKLFEVDPASAMDIYLMRADGSGLRRLTDAIGYDGGPFFSPDGSKICWRRFSPDGATAEIMTMDVDGSNPQAITRLGAMSWAPFYHPSGDYLIFATNLHGFANFELYLVDARGEREPVRVTYREGFDGLPVFTPDGATLVWTSNGGSSQSQLYEAEWNDGRARELLGLEASGQGIDEGAQQAALAAEATAPGFEPQDVGRHVDYLCRPELGGRMTGTPGEQRATAYVAAYLESLGLVPAGSDGSFFHDFEFVSSVRLGEQNRLACNGQSYEVNEQWRPVFFSREGEVEPSAIVCAGYGIVAPAEEGQEEYDSYVHLDVQDKWVLVFRQMPQDISPERRQQLARFSGARYKAMVARDRGARGLIFVSGPNSQLRSRVMPLSMDGTLGGTSLSVVSVADEVAAEWFTTAGKDIKEVQSQFDSGEPQMGFELEGSQLSALVDVEPVTSRGRNVLALLQTGSEPADELVLVGAHIDHLGTGQGGGSLATDDEAGGVHRGADDNASGVACVLEIAQYLADQVRSGKLDSKRDVLIAAWSGEELGLRGSSAFAEEFYDLYPQRMKHLMSHAHAGHGAAAHGSSAHGSSAHGSSAHGSPAHGSPAHSETAHSETAHSETAHSETAHGDAVHGDAVHGDAVPAGRSPHAVEALEIEADAAAEQANLHATTDVAVVQAGALPLYPAIAACVNLDMVGRLREKLVLQGIGSSPAWKSIIERRNAVARLALTLQDDCHLPTDASTFFLHGVPILSAFTGSHAEYHTPRDVPELLNYEGAADVAKLMALVTRDLLMSEAAPEYQDQPAQPEMRANLTAYLGTVPDYAQEDVTGVKLGGVTKGAPAEVSGVKAGDVIVELAGRKIESIYDYTYAIEALKVGQETEIKVKRGEETTLLKITPASRQ
ncbi:MAG: M28 family peptidase [bacterium]|nr:M28 family peptidase [bacterium]